MSKRKPAPPVDDRAEQIREEIARRRITPEKAGMPLDELAASAESQEDLNAYLDLFAMSPAGDNGQESSSEATSLPEGDGAAAETAASQPTSQDPGGEPSVASPETASRTAPPQTALVDVTSPGMAMEALSAPNGNARIEEAVTGPGEVTRIPPGMKALFDIRRLPWRDPESHGRLPGYDFRLVETPAIAPPDDQFLARHVDVNGLSPAQARAWRQLFLGLDKAGVRLINGRRVASQADAIRWLLEQLV